MDETNNSEQREDDDIIASIQKEAHADLNGGCNNENKNCDLSVARQNKSIIMIDDHRNIISSTGENSSFVGDTRNSSIKINSSKKNDLSAYQESSMANPDTNMHATTAQTTTTKPSSPNLEETPPVSSTNIHTSQSLMQINTNNSSSFPQRPNTRILQNPYLKKKKNNTITSNKRSKNNSTDVVSHQHDKNQHTNNISLVVSNPYCEKVVTTHQQQPTQDTNAVQVLTNQDKVSSTSNNRQNNNHNDHIINTVTPISATPFEEGYHANNKPSPTVATLYSRCDNDVNQTKEESRDKKTSPRESTKENEPSNRREQDENMKQNTIWSSFIVDNSEDNIFDEEEEEEEEDKCNDSIHDNSFPRIPSTSFNSKGYNHIQMSDEINNDRHSSSNNNNKKAYTSETSETDGKQQTELSEEAAKAKAHDCVDYSKDGQDSGEMMTSLFSSFVETDMDAFDEED